MGWTNCNKTNKIDISKLISNLTSNRSGCNYDNDDLLLKSSLLLSIYESSSLIQIEISKWRKSKIATVIIKNLKTSLRVFLFFRYRMILHQKVNGTGMIMQYLRIYV